MSVLLFLLFALASCFTVEEEEKTQSPFFYVPNEKHVEDLPLKATVANVTIQGAIAQVKVTQLYQNRGKEVIEALYVFPASTRAIVYGMQMLVNDRLLVATLYEKGEAKQKYEQAKSEGKTASLLEMERPNVYSMSVANILPGEYVRVEIFYTELLAFEDGQYRFFYPAVVMPRFSGAGAAPMTKTFYTHQGKPEMYEFQVNVEILASVPISDLYSPTHIFNFNSLGCCAWEGKISPLSAAPGTKDVEVIFSMSSTDYTGGLLSYDVHGDDGFGSPFRLNENGTVSWDTSSGESFFLAMVQPPKPQFLADPLPREYVFILDSSGSMSGFPWETSLVIIEGLLHKLRPDVDYFNMVSFSSGNKWYSGYSVLATYSTISDAIKWAGNNFGGGGTVMDGAIKEALARPSAGFVRTYALLTDGGVDNENAIFQLIRDNLGGANFFCFVIGWSPNRYLSQGVARVGKGEEYWVQLKESPEDYIRKFYQFSGHPLLKNITVEFDEGFNVYDVQYPSGILLANRPVIISGKYRGSIPTPALTVRGIQANEAQWSMEISKQIPNMFRPAKLRMLKYFWVGIALDNIRYLTSESTNSWTHTFDSAAMLKLALKYSVLTEVTSFLAVDNVVRFNTTESPIYTVNQPLPLPMGVSNAATGDFWDNAPPSYDDEYDSYSPPSYGGSGFSFSSGNIHAPTLFMVVVATLMPLFF